MNPREPQWHTTGGADIVIEGPPETQSASADPSQPMVTMSRRPAALFGIALVVCFGSLFYLGVDSLTGQLAQSAATVRITEFGFDPLEVSVSLDETIDFINETDAPHAIVSETLCNFAECFATEVIAPGTSLSVEFSAFGPGRYAYQSSLSPLMTGTVDIVFNDSTGFPSAPEDEFVNLADPVEANELLEAITQQLALDQELEGEPNPTAATFDEPTAEPPEPPRPVRGIAQNPHTVQNGARFDPAPLTPLATTNADEVETFRGGAPKPFRQPDTGASHVIVFLLAISSLWYWTRHTAKAYRSL